MESIEEMLQSLDLAYDFFARFLAAIYRYKYGTEFDREEDLWSLHNSGLEELLEAVRSKTWHRTIHSMNTLPSTEAIRLQSLRVMLSLQNPFNATSGSLPDLEMIDFGYVRNGRSFKPEWESEENRKAVNVMLKATLKKCKCRKTKCNPSKRQCVCRRTNPPSRCTSLCVCSSDCMNLDMPQKVNDDDDLEVPSEESGKKCMIYIHM